MTEFVSFHGKQKKSNSHCRIKKGSSWCSQSSRWIYRVIKTFPNVKNGSESIRKMFAEVHAVQKKTSDVLKWNFQGGWKKVNATVIEFPAWSVNLNSVYKKSVNWSENQDPQTNSWITPKNRSFIDFYFLWNRLTTKFMTSNRWHRERHHQSKLGVNLEHF